MAQEWVCLVCGYVHQGAHPPESCPVCGVGQDEFEEFINPVAPVESFDEWQCNLCGFSVPGSEPPDSCPICDASTEHFSGGYSSAQQSSGSGLHIVIIGDGIAGCQAALAARKQSENCKITLIGREGELPYYRINLTRFLAGEVNEDVLSLYPRDWYRQRHINCQSGEVHLLDRKERKIYLTTDEVIEYDRLILACGAKAFRPPIPGQDQKHVYCLRSMSDARKLIVESSSAKGAVVIGGGLLGLECAGALNKRGVKTTVLEGFDHLLPRQFAKEPAQLLKDALFKQGVSIECGVKIEKITGDSVCTADGETYAADLVVLSTGIRPETHLARKAGLDVNHGILVNEKMTTTDSHILAAGDVCEFQSRLFGIWPAAYTQGLIAGTVAAGGTAIYDPQPPATRLKVSGIDLFSIGEFNPSDGSYQVFSQRMGDCFYWLVSREGFLVGANLFGDTSLAAALTECMEKSIPIFKSQKIVDKFPQLKSI